jgi:hypothetical protein
MEKRYYSPVAIRFWLPEPDEIDGKQKKLD